jgi:hypothetical protein
MPDEIVPEGHPVVLGRADVTTKKGHRGQEHHFHHRSTRVRVIVPPPADSSAKLARPIAVAWKDHFDTTAGTSPRRKVMNLALVEHDDSTNKKYVTTFDPPIELRVTITADDTNHQPDKTKLVLGYCPKGGQWTPFSGVSLSGAQDELVVSISDWYEDPGIGVW